MFAAYESFYAISRAHDRTLFYATFKFGISAAEVFVLLEYVATSLIVIVARSFETPYCSVEP
jgi:hypothetical protein